eukprot:g15596.t1
MDLSTQAFALHVRDHQPPGVEARRRAFKQPPASCVEIERGRRADAFCEWRREEKQQLLMEKRAKLLGEEFERKARLCEDEKFRFREHLIVSDCLESVTADELITGLEHAFDPDFFEELFLSTSTTAASKNLLGEIDEDSEARRTMNAVGGDHTLRLAEITDIPDHVAQLAGMMDVGDASFVRWKRYSRFLHFLTELRRRLATRTRQTGGSVVGVCSDKMGSSTVPKILLRTLQESKDVKAQFEACWICCNLISEPDFHFCEPFEQLPKILLDVMHSTSVLSVCLCEYAQSIDSVKCR